MAGSVQRAHSQALTREWQLYLFCDSFQFSAIVQMHLKLTISTSANIRISKMPSVLNLSAITAIHRHHNKQQT